MADRVVARALAQGPELEPSLIEAAQPELQLELELALAPDQQVLDLGLDWQAQDQDCLDPVHREPHRAV